MAASHVVRRLSVALAAAILLGAFVLSLPGVSKPIIAGQKPYQWRAHVVNCLFTATAASCNTGLSVYDVGQDFTFVGQLVVLVLMQLGGLGFVVAGTLIVRECATLAGVSLTCRTPRRLAVLVCFAVLAAEVVGGAMLYGMWTPADLGGSPRWLWSTFHAVSACCSCGLSLSASSMTAYRGDWRLYAGILPLVVLASVGFPAILECLDRALRRGTACIGPVSPYTRLTLSGSVILIVGGAALLWLAETPTRLTKQHEVRMDGQITLTRSPDRMHSLPPRERLATAFFHSIVARSTGFRSVLLDEQSLSPASHALLSGLMFIGGGIGSAAGGIGPVALLLLAGGVSIAVRRRVVDGDDGVLLAGPAFGWASLLSASLFAIVCAAAFLLCYFEGRSFLSMCFEAVSAAGNAGMSTGVTSSLTRVGKGVLIVAMFAGRVVPLRVMASLAPAFASGPLIRR